MKSLDVSGTEITCEEIRVIQEVRPHLEVIGSCKRDTLRNVSPGDAEPYQSDVPTPGSPSQFDNLTPTQTASTGSIHQETTTIVTIINIFGSTWSWMSTESDQTHENYPQNKENPEPWTLIDIIKLICYIISGIASALMAVICAIKIYRWYIHYRNKRRTYYSAHHIEISQGFESDRTGPIWNPPRLGNQFFYMLVINIQIAFHFISFCEYQLKFNNYQN